MNACKAEDIREFLLRQYSEPLSAKGISRDAVPDDYDLLTEGIIDSLGILEMIGAVEKEFDLEIDYEGLDANEIAVIGPFCRYTEKNGKPAAKS